MKIVIIDYGMGNLASIYKAFRYLGFEALITDDVSAIKNASKLILPGVGAFKHAMNCLDIKGISCAIKDFVKTGKPLLGICLGLQLVFTESYEEGVFSGLDLIKGRVKRFTGKDKSGSRLKVPHIGWNSVQWTEQAKKCFIVKGLPDRSWFYFVHSYYGAPEDQNSVVGITEYGKTFASIVCKDNIYAAQFHPEKSQCWGLKVLENFIKL